jgi:hypothetical protein
MLARARAASVAFVGGGERLFASGQSLGQIAATTISTPASISTMTACDHDASERRHPGNIAGSAKVQDQVMQRDSDGGREDRRQSQKATSMARPAKKYMWMSICQACPAWCRQQRP